MPVGDKVSMPDQPLKALSVAVVSKNRETLEQLRQYLSGAGIAAHGTRRIDQTCELIRASCSVVVLFPDDYPMTKVFAVLENLKRERPSVLPVLVTQDFRRFAAPTGPCPEALVIPKPAWAWAIVDAIRARVDQRE